MRSVEEYIKLLDSSADLNVNLSFEMLSDCSSQIDENPLYSRRLCIHVLSHWKKLPEELKDAWGSVIESLGFYPYLNKEKITLSGTSETLRQRQYDSAFVQGVAYHQEQKILIDKILSGQNLIVSAPTSFGKSLLIEEIIASQRYSSIVIIQPTLALLDETRKKLFKYADSYKLIVRTSQEPAQEKKNIFLFTAERVCEYTFFQHVDFLIVDEFYKLSGSRDDERSTALNNAVYKVWRMFHPQFYMLGPNIDAISPGFEKAFNAEFYKSDYSLVDSSSVDVHTSGKKKDKNIKLFELLMSLKNEQTIIYCSSPDRVRSVSKEFCKYLQTEGITQSSVSLPLIKWIEQNISKRWSIIKALEYGIGVHDAAMPKHISASIIDYFNGNKLKWLFCTSTIIEGVNTSAKNIVYFDAYKGKKIPIDYFDYSNIKGRAGRMMVHYSGTIYNMEIPPQKEKIVVDIPFYQQNPIKDEVLIQLDEANVRNKDSEQYLELMKIPGEIRTIISKNGLSVKGQLNIIKQLRHELRYKRQLICWIGSKPKKIYLDYALKLAWDNLMYESESKNISLERLSYLTHAYGCWETSILRLIKNEADYRINERKLKDKTDCLNADVTTVIEDNAIKFILQVVRHWFEYKVPKWLSTINSLQEFVCVEQGIQAGDYTCFIKILENAFIPEHLTILKEYGIPNSAIIKIQNKIPNTIKDENIIKYIENHSQSIFRNLTAYEKEKIEGLFL